MRRCRRDKELDIANVEVRMFLQDSCPELEKWHQKRVKNELVIDVLSGCLFEIVHDSFLHHKNLHTL